MPYNFNAMDGGERASNAFVGYYNQLGLTNPNSNLVIQQAALPASPKYFFYSSYNGVNLVWSPPAGLSTTTIFSGALVYINALYQTVTQIAFNNANGATQLALAFNLNGSISVLCGSTVLATSSPGLVWAGALFNIDVQATISATAGAVQVWLNGTVVPGLTLTGVDTVADATALPVTSIFYNLCHAGVRDMYIHDGTGPAPFNAVMTGFGAVWLPAATLVSGQSTPNGQSSIVANDATLPPNPYVDFNTFTAVGQADTVGITALPANVLKVIAMAPVDYSYRTDTAGTRSLQKTLNSGAANVVGTNNALAASAQVNQDPWIVTDPTTSATLYSEGTAAIAVVNAVTVKLAVTA